MQRRQRFTLMLAAVWVLSPHGMPSEPMGWPPPGDMAIATACVTAGLVFRRRLAARPKE